ncbi:MAG: SpoIIE family protein phosphatase [Phycisphaerae bacterium]
MDQRMQVLVVNPPERTLPEGTTDLIRDIGWDITSAPNFHTALQVAGTGSVDAIIMPEPDGKPAGNDDTSEFDDLLRLVDARQIAGVMVTDRPGQRPANPRSLIDAVDREVSLPELRGRLAMIERYHGLVKRMERELNNMQRLGKQLNRHYQEVDQEMRLAGRLQRDFLPDLKEPIDNVQFASVYRPASWVSGDMYDVFRVDKENVGFYVADAVGHGMSAGLLTMFIKRAIIPKRIDGDRHKVLSPSETLANLNDALTDQSLPNSQFVTAWYGLLNHRTLTLQYARGGHPYPILITANGMVSDLKSSGGLLGIFKGEEFPTFDTQLRPGDKLLLYTDGLELAFQSDEADTLDTTSHQRAFRSLAKLPIRSMMTQIDSWLGDETGSLNNPRDDVTIIGLEILCR